MTTPEIFNYDEDGDLLSDGKFSYGWNGENRLITVSNSTALVASYAYDYLGRRIFKIVNGGETTFLWDGNHIIRERTASTTNVYTWSSNGHLVTASLNGTNMFYCHDGNKNVTDLVDVSGSVVAHYEFDPFGNEVVKTGASANANPFRFSNEYFDSKTELIAYMFRYYEPQRGRFLNRDPIAEQGGLNIYGFVRNDSIGTLDLFGLFALNLRFNAFIHSNVGEVISGLPKKWAREPNPFSQWWFQTDDRDFGQSGSSRIFSYARIDSKQIGRLKNHRQIFQHNADLSHRMRFDIDGTPRWDTPRKSSVEGRQIKVEDINSCTTEITFSNSGNYPYGLSPEINYTVTWRLERLNNGSVDMSISGVHNLFPYYEALANGLNFYNYSSPFSDPDLINLTGSTRIQENGITVLPR